MARGGPSTKLATYKISDSPLPSESDARPFSPLEFGSLQCGYRCVSEGQAVKKSIGNCSAIIGRETPAQYCQPRRHNQCVRER